MTTFARGISAPKRAVGAFFGIERSVIDRKAIDEAAHGARTAISADHAERLAIKREQGWIEAATVAAMRMHPRG